MNTVSGQAHKSLLNKSKATLSDLYAAANDLSVGDLADFHAMKAGRCPVDILTNALDETTYVIKRASRVLAVGGHPHNGIWFVTTNVAEALSQAERYSFYRMLKGHLESIKNHSAKGATLTNFVSVENHAHIRLLESLGAMFAKENSMSPAGFPFKQFWL